MKIEKAEVVDLWKILNLQKLSFKSEAELYNDYNIDPLKQTIEEIKEEYKKKIFLKASLGEELVGTVRLECKGDVCHIQKLAVHPDFQNQKIGTALMREAEKYFPQAKVFELYTGHKSDKNLKFYKKLGYEVFKVEVVKDHMHFMFFRKYTDKQTG